jgi:hypothetical protein
MAQVPWGGFWPATQEHFTFLSLGSPMVMQLRTCPGGHCGSLGASAAVVATKTMMANMVAP